MLQLQPHTTDETHPLGVPFYGRLLDKFPQGYVEPDWQITSMGKLLPMHKILVIRLYFPLDARHVSDYISPSSGATL